MVKSKPRTVLLFCYLLVCFCFFLMLSVLWGSWASSKQYVFQCLLLGLVYNCSGLWLIPIGFCINCLQILHICVTIFCFLAVFQVRDWCSTGKFWQEMKKGYLQLCIEWEAAVQASKLGEEVVNTSGMP